MRTAGCMSITIATHMSLTLFVRMTTDEEKSKISKLLRGIEVPETRLPERCSDLVKEFHKKFDKEIEEEIGQNNIDKEIYENPYRPDQKLLEENARKLKELLLSESKIIKQESSEKVVVNTSDPKRPWRTNTNKEKLLRIDNELKQHLERSTELINPLGECEMKDLVKDCVEETKLAHPIGADRLRETVEFAKKNLPNFQYRKISNSTATAIMLTAHDIDAKTEQQDASVDNSSHSTVIP